MYSRSFERDHAIVGSGALTCDQIEDLGQSVSQLELSKLQTLTAAEYTDCAYMLGRVTNFTTHQWKAIADVAKLVSLRRPMCFIVVISKTKMDGILRT